MVVFMRSVSKLTNLNNLTKISDLLIEKKLLSLLNKYNEMLASCQDEYDYMSLMVATDIFNKFVESQYKKDLIESSQEDYDLILSLKSESATNLYKHYLQGVCS